MTQTVFVPDNNIATFVCPECNASKNTDVTKYKELEKLVRLKIKCTCGSSYSVTLERRRYYRRKTDLPGNYVYRSSGGQEQKGPVSVTEISRGGLRLKFMVLPKFETGARFYVEFHLDDKQQTLIRKEVAARMITDRFIGAEFCSIDASDPSDKALGFYLL
jgi:hypothetical protein